MKTISRTFLVVLVIAIAGLLLLPGCTGLNTLQGAVADRGAAASDELRESAEWALCKAISIGSWSRAYGASKERAEAWRQLCSVKVEQTP